MQSFSELPGIVLSDAAQAALLDDGITAPSAIQAEGFAPILAGQHVVLQSGTGTGKTLAYLLPLLQRLAEGSSTRVVVLSPSAELAMQTLRVADRYKAEEIESGALVATASHKQQKERVQKNTRFVVGTPGRVLELYRARKMKNVNTLVLDEPDPILTGKDAAFLREIISRPDPKLQVVVVGATIGAPAQRLIDEALKGAVQIKAADDPMHGRIRHLIVGVREGEAKDVRMARFIDKHNCKRAVLFVREERLIGHLYRYFLEHNYQPVTLSHERPKQEHKEALRKFAAGEARLLITSDNAARGLDMADVPWVLNYDVPASAPVYIHRAGRTARAGKEGTSVSFCSPKERAWLKGYAKTLQLEFEFEAVHGR